MDDTARRAGVPDRAGTRRPAAATAAAAVLAGLHPQAEAEFKSAGTAYLATLPDGEGKSEGIRLGEAIAAKILATRATDGADAPDAYRPRTAPGVYIPTPITVASTWPNVTPFAMTSQSQFRPQAPVALNSEEWAKDYNEIKQFGGKISASRSARQTEDARFWLITGPQSTEPLVRQIAAAVHGPDRGRGGRCGHCGHGRQIPLQFLASDHGDP